MNEQYIIEIEKNKEMIRRGMFLINAPLAVTRTITTKAVI